MEAWNSRVRNVLGGVLRGGQLYRVSSSIGDKFLVDAKTNMVPAYGQDSTIMLTKSTASQVKVAAAPGGQGE